MNKLALFDFDQTLILENSLGTLFKEVSRRKRLWPLLIPEFLKGKMLRRGVRTTIKHKLYHRCLHQSDEQRLREIGQQCADRFTINQPVFHQLSELAASGIQVWVVTASPRPFIEGVIQGLGWPVARVVGTELLESEPGLYSGRYENECSHHHKELRLNSLFKEEGLTPEIVEAYGNLPADRELLSMAKKGFAVKGARIRLHPKH
ncbi:HAD-IB family phosphatase [Dongshaea marina]|uniref:HAD-IB family phosphatase n=1 Tax=Dongshaea marina TaxID=2047966 RepID=UPI000D3E055C|nr:HAD-IB family phosphatase [Dongshaea marina]